MKLQPVLKIHASGTERLRLAAFVSQKVVVEVQVLGVLRTLNLISLLDRPRCESLNPLSSSGASDLDPGRLDLDNPDLKNIP